MKNFWMKFVLVIIGSVSIVACSDVDGPVMSGGNGIKFPFYLMTGSGIEDAHGYLGVAVSTNIGPTSTSLYSTTGSFFDNIEHTSARYDYGEVMIAGKSVNAGPDMYYSESGSVSDADAPTFGVNGTWSVSGGIGGPNFTETMYVPSVIQLLSPTRAGTTITELSKSSDVIVTWNSDSNNDNVLVVLFYDGFSSHEYDPTLPIDDETLYWITDDDGSYTISSSDLSFLSVGARVRIIVARGVGSTVSGGDGKDYNLYAYSSGEGAFKVAQ